MLRHLAEFFREGGPFMHLELCVGLAMLGIVLERAWGLCRRQPPRTEHLLVQIDLLITGHADPARKALEPSSQSAVTRLTLAVLDRKPLEPVAALRALHGEALALRQALWRRLEMLPSLILIVMLLSLVGSTAGMIGGPISGSMATPEQKFALLFRGIAEALNNTAFGIILALMGQLAFFFLRGRAATQDAALARVARRLQAVLEAMPGCPVEASIPANAQDCAYPGSRLMEIAHRRRGRHQLEAARSRSLWSLQAVSVFLTVLPVSLLVQLGTQSSFYLTGQFSLPTSSSTLGNFEPSALVLLSWEGVWLEGRKLLFLPPPDPNERYGPCGPIPCRLDPQAYTHMLAGFREQLERAKIAIAARKPLKHASLVAIFDHLEGTCLEHRKAQPAEESTEALSILEVLGGSRRPAMMGEAREPTVMVMADKQIPFWLLGGTLEAAREAGFRRFALQVVAP